MEVIVNAVLLTLLAVTTLAVIPMRSLFGVVMLAGIYSFLMASVMVVLDAVDVAMTEAAVGAGVSTIIFLAALHLTQARSYAHRENIWSGVVLCGVVATALVWGTYGLPGFGASLSPIHQHVAPEYINHSMVPNVVTAVLADYRGYDTLGETTVVFTAGIGVLLLLQGRRKRVTDRDDDSAHKPVRDAETSAPDRATARKAGSLETPLPTETQDT